MDYEADDENNTSTREYRTSLRDRAVDSMSQLQRSMTSDRQSAVTPPRRGSRRPQSPQSYSPRARAHSSPRGKSPRRTHSPGEPAAWEGEPRVRNDYSYRSAVDRLRGMLAQTESNSPPRNVQFSERPHQSAGEAQSFAPGSYIPGSLAAYKSIPLPRGEIPTSEECVPILQNQAVLVQQLEAENKYCKEELYALKMKVRETVEENRLLHDELKRSVIQEILQDGGEIPGVPNTLGLSQTAPDAKNESTRPMRREDYGRWQKELERIHALHTAKASRLEAQLQHAKDEAEHYEKETEELRKDLRMRDSLNKADPELLGIAAGLCIRCATNEAVIQPSGMSAGQSVVTLTRERDDLMEQLAVMRAKYEEVRQREDDMYEQVKRSVEMVEQTQLEETQLILQRDQYLEELTAMQNRVADHAEEVMKKMAQEREIVRKEFKAEKEELTLKVKELTTSLVETQNALEKTTREKISLIADLGATKGQVDICDMDYGKATDNMKMTMTKANLERNAAVDKMSSLRKELDTVENDRDQERSRLKQELHDLRRRLGQAEKDLVETKEECIQLHNTGQALERECHLAKLSKETIEKTRSDDLKNIQRRAEHREAELNMLIDQLEAKHTSANSELENIVGSQSSLIQRLREELRQIAHKLEDVTHRYRGDNKKLKARNDQLSLTLDKCQRRVGDLEDQHTQQGALQDKMRHRLKQMDGHAGKSTQQVLELLARESAMNRDRQLLAKEVEFLRTTMLDRNEEDFSRFYSAQHGLVSDILVDVKGAEEAKLRELLPERDFGGGGIVPGNDVILKAQEALDKEITDVGSV